MSKGAPSQESTIEALIYPVCYVRNQIRRLLSPFIGRLFVVPALEDAPVAAQAPDGQEGQVPASPEIAILRRAPLGDRAEEFSQAIKALKSWGEQMRVDTGLDTYYLAMKAGATGSEEIEGIVDLIKGDKEVDRVFAARVFLALSQEADARKDEVEAELLKIHEESDKLSELVDGDSSIHSGPSLAGISLSHVEPLDRARERLREWARLAFSGPGQRADAWPVGESIAVKDIMDSAYEADTGKSPVDLVEIPIALGEGLVPQVPEDMVQAAVELMADLKGRRIEDAATAEQLSKTDLVSYLREKGGKLASAGGYGARLVVTLYPGRHWTQVILRAARMPEGSGQGTSSYPPPDPPIEGKIWGSLFLV
jgi:hypothetical protein